MNVTRMGKLPALLLIVTALTGNGSMFAGPEAPGVNAQSPELTPEHGSSLSPAEPAESHGDCRCDVTADGLVGFDDLLRVQHTWGTSDRECDFDESGFVDFQDYLLLLDSWGPCEASTCPGDLNGDGEVSFDDLIILLGVWGSFNPTADLNGDGVVDFDDLIVLLNRWGPCEPEACPGDLNADDEVSFDDLLVLMSLWGSDDRTADLDGSGVVDFDDLIILLGNWGACGCDFGDEDSDGDGTPDCDDGCPNDPDKTEPGVCGCGVPDDDSDDDGTPDCNDPCPFDPDDECDPGWTQFTPSGDSRIIYVSSSQGSDNNDGEAESRPVRTLGRGISLLRSGQPDWLLFKRGDVWTNEYFGTWSKSGRSESEPMVLGSYGSHPDRPLIKTPNDEHAMDFDGNANASHLALVGLHLTPHNRDAGNCTMAIRRFCGGRNFHVEDCHIEGYGTAMSIKGLNGNEQVGVTIRRNVIVDSYCASAHSQGMFCIRVHDLLLEENLFDHNGFLERNVPENQGGATKFNHNLYLISPRVTLRRNILSDASATGVQFKNQTPPLPGQNVSKQCIENVIVRCPIGVYANGQADDDPDGYFLVRGNVFLEGNNITDDLPRGTGIQTTDIPNGLVTDNVIANAGPAPFPKGFLINTGWPIGIEISENIQYGWGQGPTWDGDGSGLQGFTFTRNIIEGDDRLLPAVKHESPESAIPAVASSHNKFWCYDQPHRWAKILGCCNIPLDEWKDRVNDTTSVAERVWFSDPDRTLGRYHGEVINGSATHEAFMAGAREQGRGAGPLNDPVPSRWDDRYTAIEVVNWIRAGFDLAPLRN